MNHASEIFSNAQVVLLDFDGPVCSVFATVTPAQVVASMLASLTAAGHDLPAVLHERTDPHNLLSGLRHVLPDAGLHIAEDALTAAEVEAVDTATITPGLLHLLDNLQGRSYAIVSNNSSDCVERFARTHLTLRPPATIFGRPIGRPELMKPSPYLLTAVLASLDRLPDDAVFVGDSVSDVDAGIAAAVPTIGFANKPGKAEAQRAAGASAVIHRLEELISANSQGRA